MIEQFINQYPISKTLRFSLIPVGKTEENFCRHRLLESDRERAEDYKKVKEYIDRYLRNYIDRVLSSVNCIDDLSEYASLYDKTGKTQDEIKKSDALEAKMRKQIATALTSDKEYNDVTSPKKMIETILPEFVSEEEKEIVSHFKNFSTYFSGFFTNRVNMFSAEAQSTAISYRCINENLPKFLDNIKSFKRIFSEIPTETYREFSDTVYSAYGIDPEDIFDLDYFIFVLSQSGIDRYNGIIGGYACADGTKIKGLNEIINLHNQQVAKTDKSKKLPLLKMLYKQILSEKESISFIPEKFENDNEVIHDINKFYVGNIEKTIKNIRVLFDDFGSFQSGGIYVVSGSAITDLSNAVFGTWDAFSSAWYADYRGKNPVKLDEEADEAYKKIRSFSIEEIDRLGSVNKNDDAGDSVCAYYTSAVGEKVGLIEEAYRRAQALLTGDYSETNEKKLIKNDSAIEQIKALLDAVKNLEKTLKPLLGTGKEKNKDEFFYGEFLPLYEELSSIDRLYDKVRNYVTQKPYSTDKIKLNFDKPKLLEGWVDSKTDRSDNGTQYGGYLFRKLNSIGEYDYFLGISKNTKLFRVCNEVAEDDKSDYQRLDYYQLKGETIYGNSYKGNQAYEEDKKLIISTIRTIVEEYADSEARAAIIGQINSQTTPSGFLEYIKKNYGCFYNRLISEPAFIKVNNYLIENLKETMRSQTRIPNVSSILNKDYHLFPEVISDIDKITQNKVYNYFFVSRNELETALCDDKKTMFLFRISNKDLDYAEKFSAGLRKSRGAENLHTIFFKEMMSGEQSVFDIGSGQIFFRESTLKIQDTTVHHAGEALDNKNALNQKKTSTFSYDLIKDRRYTVNQFMLHLSMTINYSAPKKKNDELNVKVRSAIKNAASNNIIGIDRGERNLIYISVINDKGEIIEQHSLNVITGDNGYKVDYHKLLAKKEESNVEARKSWGTVENIKELKEGYLSQAVHEICKLVVKYDAVIAMEGLNFGFKTGRCKVEKQVYQKFENMLIAKLNYLADKNLPRDAEGGILKAYQLTNKYEGVCKGQQNGIIFYVPAWCTSKIDPTTGFVDLLRPKYTSVAAAHEFFGKFRSIAYNKTEDLFEFAFDYSDFPGCTADYRKQWVICTNGERIKTFRNPEKNNEWDDQRIVLTPAYKELFDKAGIDCSGDIKAGILANNDKDFLYRLIGLLRLTLQMRNSVTGSTNPEDDYLISPVRNASGEFYDSRNYRGQNAVLPTDADANGAYNIARKALWAIGEIKKMSKESDKVSLDMNNAEWLAYAQK